MQKLIDNFYYRVKDLINKEDFINEINKIKKYADNLFDENICALLVIDKLNGGINSICKISNLEPGMDATVIAKVVKIGDVREFKKKNMNIGRVLNLKIMDSSGICRLVLWDKDVDLLKKNSIKLNSKIKLINGYVKNGLDGVEINIGKWSLITFFENNNYLFEDNLENKKSISGRILEILPTRPFFKDDGDYGFVTSLKIKEKNQIKKLFVWDEKVKEIQNFKTGDFISFENVDYKNKNGIIENHIIYNSVIKKN